MNFAAALSLIEAGDLVHRDAWPKGEFAFLVAGSTFQVNRAPLNTIFPNGTSVSYRPHIDRCYENETIGYWTPTQDDVQATDWAQFAYPAPVASVVAEPVATPAVAVEPAPAAEVAPVVEAAAEPAVTAAAPVVETVAAPVVEAAVTPTATPVIEITMPTATSRSNVTTLFYVQESPTAPIFTPKWWSASTKTFVPDLTLATSYATEALAQADAANITVKTHITRRTKIG